MQFRQRFRFVFPVLSLLALTGHLHSAVAAERATVCTITVNSPDEKDVLRRSLPEDRFDFVELVERGRSDWLGSACRSDVHCDVLVISGHFDAGTEFYTDRLDQRESLPVEEMERAACSASCGGLFSRLKEVYLFGCNTLNGETVESTGREVARTLQRSGRPPGDAAAIAQALEQRFGESNRDTMRRIFSHVPVIYGFASLAPLGRYAGPTLSRVLQSGGTSWFGTGIASPPMLKAFGPSSMISVAGLDDSGPRAASRPQFCEFVDDRRTPADRVDSVHRLIGRDPAEARMLIDRVERVTKSLSPGSDPAPVTDALSRTASDRAARDRWLGYARLTDRPEVRMRLLKVAAALGWLTPEEERVELVRTLSAQVELGQVSAADVDLACALNRDGSLDSGLARDARLSAAVPAVRAGRASNAGVLACLGNADARSRVLKALTSADAGDVQIAQVVLRHRPLSGGDDVRDITRAIARMPSADAQVLALETLGQHHLSDRDALADLVRLYAGARSVAVQRAVAGVLIRADRAALPGPDLGRELRRSRIASHEGADIIDALMRRL